MKVANIQEINDAVFVIKHFIDLSARLLPMLYSLDKKVDPSEIDRVDKNRIMDVFGSYHFETDTSKLLIESNILELIKGCYHTILYAAPDEMKKDSLIAFLNEYNRLKEKWKLIESN